MDSNLERYLNDHFAGSAGAVDLIQALADHSTELDDKRFFTALKTKVEDDRLLLRDLLDRVGQNSSKLLAAAGNLTAKASRLKLVWEGLDPGRLGMFEALEVLTLGIQGKRLLWRMLAELMPRIPEWDGIDFTQLEKEAVEQRDAVEDRRIRAGLEALIDDARLSGSESTD